MRTDQPSAEIVELLAICRLCPTDVYAIYQTLALFAHSF